MKRYLVYYRKKKGLVKSIQLKTHAKPETVTDKEFRLQLIKHYIRANRRILAINILRKPEDV